jgi:uncharacterized protein with HEPN domain
MSRDPEYLVDILAAARLALKYTSGKTREQFLADTQCQDAVIRRLEVIGEAARRISEDSRAALPRVPWKDIVAMRNILIHKYDGVDLVVVWDTVQEHLPALIRELEKAIPGGNPPQQ